MEFLNVLYFGFLFIFGLAVGSFINAFEYRLKNNIDFVKERSKCPKCKHVLSPIDLVPLFSYIFLRGRCRYCEKPVSRQYPIVEFIAGTLFLLSGWYVSTTLHSYGLSAYVEMILFALLFGHFFAFFLFLAVYDVKHQIVSNRVIYPAIIAALVANAVIAAAMQWSEIRIINDMFPNYSIAWNMLGSVLGGFFIFLIIFFTGGKGMGGGDFKLVIFMGLVLGLGRLIIAVYIAVILGAVGGIIWGVVKNNGKIRGMKLPFALFLSIGAVISYIWGQHIIDYYFVWI